MSNLKMEFVPIKCENLMDCLLYLLRYFNLLELMELQGICHRLDSLSYQSRTRFSDLNFENLSSNYGVKLLEIVQFLGPVIKSLNLGSNSNYFEHIENKYVIFDWINEHCVNLETFDLGCVALKDVRTIHKFTPLVHRLKSLRLCGSNFDDSLSDYLKGASMEELKVDGNHKITENFFKNVSNLKYLNISYCKNLSTDSYINISKQNLKLKNLTIDVNDIIFNFNPINLNNSHDLVNYIANNLHEIEELTFNVVSSEVNLFGDLPKLKKLRIVRRTKLHQDLVSQDMNKLLEKLSEKNTIEEFDVVGKNLHINIDHFRKLSNLKKLSLDRFDRIKNVKKIKILENLEILSINCVEDDAALFSFVDLLQNLKELNLPYHRVGIAFFEELIQTLRHSENRRKLHVCVAIIYVGQNSDVYDKLIKSNEDIIDVGYLDLDQQIYDDYDFDD